MRPLITAHAGCEGTPPNTIESLAHAFNSGADLAETDVRCTADKVPVLSHDDFFKGMVISETACKDLEGIVPLKDALIFAGINRYYLNLDIKDFSAVDEAYNDIKNTGSLRNVILSGCTPEQSRDIRKKYPSLRTMANISKNFIPDSLLAEYDTDRELFVNKLADIYSDTGCMCLNISINLCSRETVDKMKKSYIPLSVWTVDDPAAAVSLAELGVYSITTNAVSEIISALKNR